MILPSKFILRILQRLQYPQPISRYLFSTCNSCDVLSVYFAHALPILSRETYEKRKKCGKNITFYVILFISLQGFHKWLFEITACAAIRDFSGAKSFMDNFIWRNALHRYHWKQHCYLDCIRWVVNVYCLANIEQESAHQFLIGRLRADEHIWNTYGPFQSMRENTASENGMIWTIPNRISNA